MTDASNAQRSNARRVQGGCHCGAVRFRATVTEVNVVRCNCSICTKKGGICTSRSRTSSSSCFRAKTRFSLDDFDVTSVEIYEFDGHRWEENIEALRKR